MFASRTQSVPICTICGLWCAAFAAARSSQHPFQCCTSLSTAVITCELRIPHRELLLAAAIYTSTLRASYYKKKNPFFSTVSRITAPRHYTRVSFTAFALSTHTSQITAPRHYACFATAFAVHTRTHPFNTSLSRSLKSRAAYLRLQACPGAKLVAPRCHPWAHVWRSSVWTATPFNNFRRCFNTAARTLRRLQIQFFRPPKLAASVWHFSCFVARSMCHFRLFRQWN